MRQNKVYKFFIKYRKKILIAQTFIFAAHLLLVWYSLWLLFTLLWLAEAIAVVVVMWLMFYKEK